MLDKAISVLDAVEAGPLSLAGLVEATGLRRATAHRLAVALEVHRLVGRDGAGRFVLGPRLTGPRPAGLARPALEALRDATGESAQLYVRRGDRRLCVASLESPHGLRTIVACRHVAAARRGLGRQGAPGRSARRWAESVEERERGVASASAPVRVRAATCRRGVGVGADRAHHPRPGRRYGPALVKAAQAIERQLSGR